MKQWWEEDTSEFVDGFSETSEVHHTPSDKELEAIYGPPAPHSEHVIGEHIVYTSAEGTRASGTIIYVQARFESIPIKYVVAPDEEGQFLDFVLPADVITQDEPSDELTRCPYCKGMHPRSQVEACPLRPHKE